MLGDWFEACVYRVGSTRVAAVLATICMVVLGGLWALCWAFPWLSEVIAVVALAVVVWAVLFVIFYCLT